MIQPHQFEKPHIYCSQKTNQNELNKLCGIIYPIGIYSHYVPYIFPRIVIILILKAIATGLYMEEISLRHFPLLIAVGTLWTM